MSGIELRGIRKSFGGRPVLHGVDLSVAPGQVVGLVGPNGSGKTTLLRASLGLTSASGTALFDGLPLRDHPRPGRVVGAVLDPSAHAPHRTVRQMVRSVATFTSSDARVDSTLDEFGLASVRNRRFGKLSLGMQQRAALAVAFLAAPRYLVVDEPMNGLDVNSAEWLARRTRAHADQGGGVLISSHLLRELQEIVDSVVILSLGTVTYAGPPRRDLDRVRVVAVPEHRAELVRALTEAGHPFEEQGDALTVSCAPADVSRVCLAAGVVLTELSRARGPRRPVPEPEHGGVHHGGCGRMTTGSVASESRPSVAGKLFTALRAELRKVHMSRRFTVISGICLALVVAGLVFEQRSTEGPVELSKAVAQLGILLWVVTPLVCAQVACADFHTGEMQTWFVLEPRRWVVLVAKLLCGMILSLVIVATSWIFAVLLTAAGGVVFRRPLDLTTDIQEGMVMTVPVIVVGAIMGIAWGILVQRFGLTALIIIGQATFGNLLMLLLPDWLGGYLSSISILGWFDGSATFGNFVSATTLWCVAPFVAGLVRVRRQHI